jgi:hypothetical protein
VSVASSQGSVVGFQFKQEENWRLVATVCLESINLAPKIIGALSKGSKSEVGTRLGHRRR